MRAHDDVLRAAAKMARTMAKPKKKKPPAQPAVPELGRLGAQRWLAVRQKAGAGPIEPKTRRGTRADLRREALAREAHDVEGKDV
jgi:hypothetical protein